MHLETMKVGSVLRASAVAILFCLPALPQASKGWSPDEDIVAHLEKQPDQSIFVAALKSSGLRDRLKSPGRFTVLAPTNEAFGELPPGMLNDLMKPSSKQQLARLIGCHIISHEIKFGSRPIAPQSVATLGGCNLRFARSGGDITVKDENGIVGKLLMSDVFEANGQIEVIDSVLTPSLRSLKSSSRQTSP